MNFLQVLGLILIITGAVLAFFVRRLIKDSVTWVGEGGDPVAVLTPRAMAFKLIGFAAVVTGAIMVFI